VHLSRFQQSKRPGSLRSEDGGFRRTVFGLVGTAHQALAPFHFAVGITNSAPLAMVEGQRCITDFCLV
jgi:hypothetical protein